MAQLGEIRIFCQRCGETYKASAQHAGRAIRCVSPGCDTIIHIQSQSPSTATGSSTFADRKHFDAHESSRKSWFAALYGIAILIPVLVAFGLMFSSMARAPAPAAPVTTARAGSWYQLAPPLERVDQPGPLTNDWQHVGAFDSAQECEGSRARWRADALKDTVAAGKHLRERRTEAELASAASEMERTTARLARASKSQCVAADDPRLRPLGPVALLAVIPFSRGHRIYVQAWINASTPARLQLDTAADRTMIAPLVLRAAGLVPHGAGLIRGVTGRATADLYQIASLEVGGAKSSRLTVFGYDIGETESDGLLGRDFLDQFKITIDNAGGRVTLSAK
jgi:hypothetical protein